MYTTSTMSYSNPPQFSGRWGDRKAKKAEKKTLELDIKAALEQINQDDTTEFKDNYADLPRETKLLIKNTDPEKLKKHLKKEFLKEHRFDRRVLTGLNGLQSANMMAFCILLGGPLAGGAMAMIYSLAHLGGGYITHKLLKSDQLKPEAINEATATLLKSGLLDEKTLKQLQYD